jgi:DNA replication protein DnaC
MTLQTVTRKLERLKMVYSADRLQDLIMESTRLKETPIEFLERVVTLEVECREESRIATSLKVSGLPKGMRLDTFDFTFQPLVNKASIDHLATGEFIRRKENVLFLGPPGVGKTHLSSGLGVRAVELGYSVSYYLMEELIQTLKKRQDVPVNKHTRNGYIKNALVIVDELGHQVLDRRETHLFFQFISARYLKGSIIIAGNRSVSELVKLFADDEMATTAILDRVLHRVHIFSIDGKSYRLKDLEQTIRQQNASP